MSREIAGSRDKQIFSFEGSQAIRVMRPPKPQKSSGKKKKIIYIPTVNKKSRYD